MKIATDDPVAYEAVNTAIEVLGRRYLETNDKTYASFFTVLLLLKAMCNMDGYPKGMDALLMAVKWVADRSKDGSDDAKFFEMFSGGVSVPPRFTKAKN